MLTQEISHMHRLGEFIPSLGGNMGNNRCSFIVNCNSSFHVCGYSNGKLISHNLSSEIAYIAEGLSQDNGNLVEWGKNIGETSYV
jgi:hypothetical protein